MGGGGKVGPVLQSVRVGDVQLRRRLHGQGMRVVRAKAEFQVMLESARREAAASFGDTRVLIEKCAASWQGCVHCSDDLVQVPCTAAAY